MDDLFARIERPSRYLGNELNAVRKDLATVTLRVGLAYPDLYEIGMSNTGLHIIYYLLNERPEVAAERVYLPAADLEELLLAEGRLLTTLENRQPLRDLDVLGIQLPHELAYANIVKLLRLGGVPVWSHERGEDDPIVLGGGPGAFAPEPVAPFYDAFLLGDAEEALLELLAVVEQTRDAGLPRAERLRRLAGVTGVYVPSLYRAETDEAGRVAAVVPQDEAAPATVTKAVLQDLEGAFYPDRGIVPYAETIHTRVGVEVMRGCTVGCRFCQAGMIYRPLRERSPERILDLAKCGLGATGFEAMSLLSLDTGDYTLIEPLTQELLARNREQRVALSLPSLRAGSLTDEVIRDIRSVRRTSFTIAPEAGSQRLRDVINKNISDEEIFETVERVARGGWRAIKLYFMVGFPTETDEDLQGLVDLVTRCRQIGRRYTKQWSVTASLGTLVPKPHTPFQWDAQIPRDEALRRLLFVSRQLRPKGIGCKYHDVDHSWLEGVFSRGDRRLAPVIADAEARGAGFESWDDRFDLDLWLEVFADHGIDPQSYHRARDDEETLPWDHLSAGVTRSYLLNDRKKVDRLATPTTFDCRDDLCAGCAVCFEGDVRNRLAKYGEDPFGDGRRLPIALTSRIAMGHGVARQLEKSLARDQAAKAGEDALQAKLRRRRPKKPGKRRLSVTPGAPGTTGPARAFDPDVLAAEAERADAIERAAEAERADAIERAAEAERADEAERAAKPRNPRAKPVPPAAEDQPNHAAPAHHVRVTYERRGDLRWLAHREVMRTVYRALRRTDLPVRWTRGFNPKPRIAFGPPLPVGAESRCETLDLYLEREVAPEAVVATLRAVFPVEQGLVPIRAEHLERRSSAHSERGGARWSLDLASVDRDEATARAQVEAWETLETLTLEVTRGKKGARSIDLKSCISAASVDGGALTFEITYGETGAAKPYEAAAGILGLALPDARAGRFLLLETLARQAAPA